MECDVSKCGSKREFDRESGHDRLYVDSELGGWSLSNVPVGDAIGG